MTALLNVLSIFLLILLGFVSSKVGWLPLTSSKYLSAVVLNIAFPCAVINSLAGREFTKENAIIIVTIMGLFAASMVVIWAVSLLFVNVFHIPKKERGNYKNLVIFPNNGFMGLPLAQALFGAEGFFLMVITNIVTPFILYSYGVWNLTRHNDSGKKFNYKTLLSAPIIASLIGLIIFFTRLPIPGFISKTIALAAACMTPLCMMVIGIQLSTSSVKGIIKKIPLLAASLAKVLVVPLVIFGLSYPLKFAFGPLVPAVLVLNAMMPTGATNAVLAEYYESDPQLSSEGSFLSTLFSIGTVPLFTAIIHIVLKV